MEDVRVTIDNENVTLSKNDLSNLECIHCHKRIQITTKKQLTVEGKVIDIKRTPNTLKVDGTIITHVIVKTDNNEEVTIKANDILDVFNKEI